MSDIDSQIPGWMPVWRRLKDGAATAVVSAGGAGVLVAILLILFYLVYEVVPLFDGATADTGPGFNSSLEQVRYAALEEQGEIAMLVDAAGNATFFQLDGGETVLTASLRLAVDKFPQLIVEESPQGGTLAASYPDGSVLLVQHRYRLSYPDDKRLITPRLEFPYGRTPIQLGDEAGLVQLAVRDSEEALLLAAQSPDGKVWIKQLDKEENFLSGEVELVESNLHLPAAQAALAALHLSSDQRWLVQLEVTGEYKVWDLQDIDDRAVVALADSGQLFERGGLSSSAMLLGGISLLAASDQGELAQFFMVRDEQGARLERIRDFDTGGSKLVKLVSEHRRKGFIGLDASGDLHVFHSTAGRSLLRQTVTEGIPNALALAPRADMALVVASDGAVASWEIHNKHPEISWSALWQKVWYESYPEPQYTWQSSASNNDFEPKYSFSPLAFGTLKAAFYAMLIGAPLAICGAIYTAYFMAPALRRKVKPLIELMEALPTVILGFLAGLWLAPFIESNLTGVFSLLLLLPPGVLLFAFAWSRLPLNMRTRVPEGWHAAILIPVVCVIALACFQLNDQMELWLFGGDMRAWITQDLGISFDQRNAMVVGIAMGMAVIPTIFSISEDAIFSVPKHLGYGSLALGATPWQTLVGVIIPTASPGIFSGLMIGMGRAVGETMIVLMATGNTPIMDANIFEGMRTLAANIAVEVPEAEVDSTHYRVLFLAAFVLFMFTFIVNTIAEIVRQRLRIKYGSL